MYVAIVCCIALLVKLAQYLEEYLTLRNKNETMLKHFPTPARVPIVGNYYYYPTDPGEIFQYFMSFPRKLGKNVAIWGIFNHVELLVSRQEDVELIMAGKSTKKSHLYDFIQPWLGEGLLISHGTKWYSRRKIITPTFHFKILEQFMEVFNEQDKKLVQKLEKYAQNKEDCNIYEYLTAVALDNICETAMGVKINAQDNPNSEYITAVKEMGIIIFNRIFSLLNQYPQIWNFTPSAFKARRLVKTLHAFTNSVISNRREQLESLIYQKQVEQDEVEGRKQKFSFLDMLLLAKVDGQPLSNNDIREEVDTFMFEGHDTTTSGMTFTMYHLAMNPDVQERAFEELRAVLGDDPNVSCNYNSLQELKYLEKVIKESLRLHPSVPVIGRKTLEPIQIDGITIPANFDITIPIYAIHRNPDVFPDPEKFDPERFDEEKDRSWGPFDYIPFSAGTRNCIGQKFAMLEMKAVISTILRHFKVIATDKTKNMIFRSDLVLRPVDGLFVGLEKRAY